MDSSEDTIEASEIANPAKSSNKGKGIDRGVEVDGKPAAPKTPPSTTVANTSHHGSFPGRILNSVASLSAAFQGPTDYASWTTSSLSMGEKARGSSSVIGSTETPFASRSVASSTMVNQSFHTPSVAETDKESEFDTFVDRPMPSAAVEVDRVESQLDAPSSRATTGQEKLDGDEVIAILEAQGLDWGMSEGVDDILSPSDAQRLHATLFSGTAEYETSWDHLLNFWPNQGRHFSDEHDGWRGHSDGDCFGSREAWLKEWKDVLVHYTDQVWGDLGPMTIQARDELDMQAEIKSPPQLEALGRLRMILLHLRGAQ